MRRCLILCLFTFIGSLVCWADAGKDAYLFRKVDYQQGLSNSAVLCLYQDLSLIHISSANNFTSGRYYDPNNPSRLYFDADKSKVLKQWKDREPRFYVNITYSGSIWLNEGKYNEEMRTDFTNGANGTCGKSKASGDCPDSGYLIRRGAKASNNNGSKHFSPVLRLADMYLGYAEALCMCSDLDNALTYLNKIRVRAGIPEYTFTATSRQKNLSEDTDRSAEPYPPRTFG